MSKQWVILVLLCAATTGFIIPVLVGFGLPVWASVIIAVFLVERAYQTLNRELRP